MVDPAAVPDADAAPAARAEAAADGVVRTFGGRALGLPGTHLARVQAPAPPAAGLRRLVPAGPWHYWWQAHYLEALLDRAERLQAAGRAREAAAALRMSRRLARGIAVRNGLRWTNSFYDDMAWLALATHRLGALGGGAGTPRQLTAALVSAHTPELGGGLWWNRDRNYKNTAATGPAALHFARLGERRRAQELVDWLRGTLQDPKSGLFLDGIRMRGTEPALDRAVYSYNQGPVLGALLELGGSANLAAAADLVEAVAVNLAGPDGVLRSHDGGDGGLFTGILARYLAAAAVDPRLPDGPRTAAADLLHATADALWAGRGSLDGRPVFARHAGRDTGAAQPPGTAVGLSTQLQAWLVFEAAARAAGGGISRRP